MTEERDGSTPNMIILDMGRKKKKQVKRLRKGKGKLVRSLHETVDELIESDVIDSSSQVVVLVVREKKGSKGWKLF